MSARGVASALAAALVGAATFVPAAQAGWGRPFQFTQPGSLDLIPAQLAFSPGGAAAVGFGVQDVDSPGASQAYLVTRPARGSVGRVRAVAGARQVLALGYDGRTLELLTGTSAGGETCCSSVQSVRMSASGVLSAPGLVVGGLTGSTEAQLLTLGNGGLLAAVGTERGVWVGQADPGHRFGAAHRLTGRSQMPGALAAAGLGGQSTIVAWTQATGPAGATDPRSILYATGSGSGPPRRARPLLSVAPGHRIDELGIAARGSGATAAWVQSWYDRRGNLHSEIDAAEIGPRPVIRRLSAPGRPASGLTIAAGATGDQAVSWDACRPDGSCTAEVADRGPTQGFGPARSFGAIDPSQAPAVAVGPTGQAIAGWIRSGQPVAVVGSARSGRFGAPRILSSSAYAFDLSLAVGPRHRALAVWSQGTLNPSVVGAAYAG